MVRRLKRILSLILIITILMPNVVFATEENEINLDGLRVSDEFAAKYPHGMFEVVSPLIMTKEGEEFEFIVVRRGGTEGAVSVSLKAIETIAKYGDDFVLMEKGMFGIYHELKKSEDNPTMLESYIEENKDMVFTSDRAVSASAIDIITDDDLSSGSAVMKYEPTQETIEDISEVTSEVTEETNIEYSDELGSYTSYLHKMKDEATGNKTAANAQVSESLDDFLK